MISEFHTLVTDAQGVDALSAAVARRLTGTHDCYQLLNDDCYLDREDADDIHGTVECLDRLFDSPVLRHGDVPQTELHEVGEDACYHRASLSSQLNRTEHQCFNVRSLSNYLSWCKWSSGTASDS